MFLSSQTSWIRLTSLCLISISIWLVFTEKIAAQSAVVSYIAPYAQPDGTFIVCGNAESMTMRFANNNATTMTGIAFTLHLPPGGTYTVGSITGATEVNIIDNCTTLSRNLVAGWGCGGSNCQTSNVFPVGITIPNNVPNLVGTVKFPMGKTMCSEANYPVRYVIKNTGTGPATAIGAWFSGAGNSLGSYTANNGGMYSSWYIPTDWQYSINNSVTLNPITVGTVVPKTNIYLTPSVNTTSMADAFFAGMPEVILPVGDSIILTGSIHAYQLTDSTYCGYKDNWGYFSHKPLYSNQCGTAIVTGSTGLTGVICPSNENNTIALSTIGIPAFIAKNTCADFEFRANYYMYSPTADIATDPNRYAEMNWILPAGLTYNSLTIQRNNFAAITPYSGYPQVVGNKLIVRFDPKSGIGNLVQDNFRIKLSLCNACPTTGGDVTIPMSAYYVRHKTCVPMAWDATTCLSLTTKLEGCSTTPCPTGGTNIDYTTSYMKRTTFGLPDNNLDGLPDASGSLDFTKVRTFHYAEGDTMRVSFKSTVTTGSVASLISSGLDMTIDTTSWIKAGAATVKIYDVSTGTSYTCTVPVTFSTGGIKLNLQRHKFLRYNIAYFLENN